MPRRAHWPMDTSDGGGDATIGSRAGGGLATHGKSSFRMNSSRDYMRFSARSAHSSTRFKRASIRSN
jgi:hypothetical protein